MRARPPSPFRVFFERYRAHWLPRRLGGRLRDTVGPLPEMTMKLVPRFPSGPGLLCSLSVLVCALPATAQRIPDTRLDTDPPGASASFNPQIAASGSAVYVVWEDYRRGPGQPDVYFNRSLDGGATWLASDVRVNAAPAGPSSVSLGPQVAASGAAVYVVWADTRNGQADIYFNRSLDGGQTWLGDVRLDTDTPGAAGSSNPQIVVIGSSVYVVWYDIRNGSYPPGGLPTANDLYFNRSLDAGMTWLPSDVRVDDNPTGSKAQVAHITAAGASVYVTWMRRTPSPFGTARSIHLNRSTDGGSSWLGTVRLNTTPPTTGFAEDPRVAVSGSTVFVVWSDSRNGQEDLYYNRSLDGGATWLAADQRFNSDPPGVNRALRPEVAVSGSWVYVGWGDLTRVGPGGGFFLNRSTDGGVTWWASEIQIPGLSNPFSGLALAAVGAAVHVSTGQSDYTRSLDGGTTWLASPMRLSNSGGGGRCRIVATGSSVHATWEDGRNGPLPANTDIYFNVAFGLLPYGAGTAGAGGLVPVLAGTGRATLGDRISLDTTRGTAGGPAALLVGGGPATKIAVPVLGGTLLVAPVVALPFQLAGGAGVPGAGSASIPLVLPSTPSALGANVNFQSLILDSGAPQGVSMTNGVELWIG